MSEMKKQSTVAEKLKDHLSGNVDDQCEKGLKTYNKTLDECAYDDYDWNLMANQELVDSNQYMLMEIGKLNELLKEKDEEIARLNANLSAYEAINNVETARYTAPRVKHEQSPKAALGNTVDEYKAVSERDEIIEDLEDEIEGLKKQLKSLGSEYWDWRSSANKAVSENKKLRELLAHTWGED